MSERGAQAKTRSTTWAAARGRVIALTLISLATAGVAFVFWRAGSSQGTGDASQPDLGSPARKVKYWWDPMMTPPYIVDHPGKSPMGMDLVPVYDDAQDSSSPAGANTAGGTPAVGIYYCPMHPSYTSKHPGECPICNMRLVQMKDGPPTVASDVEGHATVTIDSERRQLIGVRSGAVERKSVQKSIRAVGRVEYDERRLSAVNLKVGGWIEELFVKSVGEEVAEGDPLFSIYSPELIEAQRNYLLAWKAARSQDQAADVDASFAQATLRSARERLVLLDLGESQIQELESAQEVPRITTILSDMAGVVTRRNVVQGSAVEAGVDLFELADLATVWVHADVYEYELPLVHAGLTAWIQLSSQPGEPVSGDVVFVYPYLDEATRTARVRIGVPNDRRRLKPGMFATVFIASELGEQLVIDDQAVLDTGTRQLVFVDLGDGRLEPRAVQLGEHVDGEIVVLKGLSEGERVVVSGNFLVDSESRLKAALLGGVKSASSEHEGHRK